MANHQLNQAYTKAFETFLSHTNEKLILLEYLGKLIQSREVSSVLDIGAGNGDLAIPLAREVGRYVAVEQKPNYANTLRNSNLFVYQAVFPCLIDGKFDLVLGSHIIPWRKEEYTPLIFAAWDLVATYGQLVLITYDDTEHSAWNELRDGCNLPTSRRSGSRIDLFREVLETLGEVEVIELVTAVETNTLDELCQALAFVYSDGEIEKLTFFLKNEAVRTYLETNHKTEGRYSFPFTHYVLQVSKLPQAEFI